MSTLCDPVDRTAAHQAPLSLGFSRQESWSGLPFPSPVTEYIFLGSKITADGDCSHEIKRSLLLGRKVVTNLDSILKNRDITLPTKVHIVKAMAFPVVMYGYESWTIKKSEHQRIDDFELWCTEDPWESLGQQGGQTSESWRKSTLTIHWNYLCWSWSFNILSTWCE